MRRLAYLFICIILAMFPVSAVAAPSASEPSTVRVDMHEAVSVTHTIMRDYMNDRFPDQLSKYKITHCWGNDFRQRCRVRFATKKVDCGMGVWVWSNGDQYFIERRDLRCRKG